MERALWTLLLPFTLANVALHARPGIPPDPDKERWASRSGITAWLIRLFCLSLTCTLVLTADRRRGRPHRLAVRRAGLPAAGSPARGSSSAEPLVAHGRPGARRRAAGATAPCWPVLGRRRLAHLPVRGARCRADPHHHAPARDGRRSQPAAARSPRSPRPTRCRTRRFWSGEGQLRRAAVLHLCVGAAVAAAVPVGAVLVMDPARGVRAVIAWPTVAAARRRGGDRRGGGRPALADPAQRGHPARPVEPRRRRAHRPGPGRDLHPPAAAGRARRHPAAAVPPAGRVRPCSRASPAACTDHSLPGYDGLVAWLATDQVLLLIAIGAVARSGRRALLRPGTGRACCCPSG